MLAIQTYEIINIFIIMQSGRIVSLMYFITYIRRARAPYLNFQESFASKTTPRRFCYPSLFICTLCIFFAIDFLLQALYVSRSGYENRIEQVHKRKFPRVTYGVATVLYIRPAHSGQSETEAPDTTVIKPRQKQEQRRVVKRLEVSIKTNQESCLKRQASCQSHVKYSINLCLSKKYVQ